MLEAVLFDMDGVLVDSEPAHAAATSDALREIGLDGVTGATYERYFLGRADRNAFRDYLAAAGRPDIDVEDLVRRKAAAYQRRFAEEVAPQADGLETLRGAVARGFRAAIVSGALSVEIAQVVARFDLGGLVSATVGGDEVAEGKPHPAPYLLGARRLGVPPERCLVVEDAPAGVEAARRAGMRCLAVDRLGRPERLAGADLVVETLSIDAVERLRGARPGTA